MSKPSNSPVARALALAIGCIFPLSTFRLLLHYPMLQMLTKRADAGGRFGNSDSSRLMKPSPAPRKN